MVALPLPGERDDGWLLYAVWPYTRLVHVWSVPVGYLARSPIVYRAKRSATGTALR